MLVLNVELYGLCKKRITMRGFLYPYNDPVEWYENKLDKKPKEPKN